MQQYSIVISIYGWCAKNMLTGKELSGGYGILPIRIAAELHKLLVPSTHSLCLAAMVHIPNENEFNLWFFKQPVYP